MRAQRGFTLTELVIVLIITGVLAAVAVPRLFDQNDFAAKAAHDFTVSTVRYAQKSAIAARRSTCVVAKGTIIKLIQSPSPSSRGCPAANGVLNPSNGLRFDDPENALPGGVTFVDETKFIFDVTGRPVGIGGGHQPISTVLSIAITGYPQPVTIEPETGLVR